MELIKIMVRNEVEEELEEIGVAVQVKHLKERPSKLRKNLKVPERDIDLKVPERGRQLTTR
jgi:hypothetical protein